MLIGQLYHVKKDVKISKNSMTRLLFFDDIILWFVDERCHDLQRVDTNRGKSTDIFMTIITNIKFLS